MSADSPLNHHEDLSQSNGKGRNTKLGKSSRSKRGRKVAPNDEAVSSVPLSKSKSKAAERVGGRLGKAGEEGVEQDSRDDFDVSWDDVHVDRMAQDVMSLVHKSKYKRMQQRESSRGKTTCYSAVLKKQEHHPGDAEEKSVDGEEDDDDEAWADFANALKSRCAAEKERLEAAVKEAEKSKAGKRARGCSRRGNSTRGRHARGQGRQGGKCRAGQAGQLADKGQDGSGKDGDEEDSQLWTEEEIQKLHE
jgi:hypothetical protein